MRYATIKYNDIANAPGIAVSFFTQGCPHRCHNCFNPETWDFNGGQEFTTETLDNIIKGLTANGIKRSFCVLGGEPLCEENLFLTNLVVSTVKEKLPDTKIYIWTGYIYEDLLQNSNHHLKHILSLTDTIVDGPFIEEQKDLTLAMRGSKNQRIINLTLK